MTLHEQYTTFLEDRIPKNLQNQKPVIYDYACEGDFNKLWRLGPLDGKSQLHIIIVWEKTYDTDTNPLLASHLTPMDWALAYSAKMPIGRLMPLVYIVDLTGEVHNEWAMQPEQRSGLLKNMPWVRLYAPLIPESGLFREGYQLITAGELAPPDSSIATDKATPLLLINQEEETLTATLNPRADPSVLSEKQKKELIKLVGELKSDNRLSHSGDHHDISNLIGPALLIHDGVYGALAKRVCFDDPKDQEASRPPSFQEINNVAVPLRIIVIDDYIDKGWKLAFQNYFGAEPSSIELQCSTDPTDLVEKIEKLPHTQKSWNFSFFNEEFYYIDLENFNNTETEEVKRKLLENPNGVPLIVEFDTKFFKEFIQPNKKDDVDCSAEFKKALVEYAQNHNRLAWNYGLQADSRLWMISGKEKAQEILFFDLRLFPQQGDKISTEEKNYFNRVCSLAIAPAKALARRICEFAREIPFLKGAEEETNGIIRELEEIRGKIRELEKKKDNLGRSRRERTEKEIEQLNKKRKLKEPKEKLHIILQILHIIEKWPETQEPEKETSEHYKALTLLPRALSEIAGEIKTEEEKNAFSRVSDLANAFEEKVPFLEEIKKIKEWLETKEPEAETPIHYKALTLLPRVLSTIDPSYPIILFSATGRRDIMESVRPFRNIITSFEKPDLDTLSSTSKRQTALNNFESALRESLKIIHGRKHCQALQKHGVQTPIQGQTNVPDEVEQGLNEEEQQEKGYHIELFIDETGLGTDGGPGAPLPPFRVGGCFALFSDNDLASAQRKADAFDDELVRGGVLYTEYQHNAMATGQRAKERGMGCADTLQELFLRNRRPDEEDSRPDKIGLVSIQGKDAYTDYKNPFFLYGDRAFLNPLEVLVEGFLYEALPQIAASIEKKPEEISVSIFADTRVDIIPSTELEDHEWSEKIQGVHEYEFATGMEYNLERTENSPWIFRHSLDSGHFAPIVQRIIEQREEFRNITRALAVPLVKNVNNNRLSEKYIPFLCRKCGARYSVKHIKKTRMGSCSYCQSKDIRLDVRALHYVANQILTKCFEHWTKEQYNYTIFGKELRGDRFVNEENEFVDVIGEFVDVVDDDFENIMRLSKKIDMDGPVLAKAIADFPLLQPERGEEFSLNSKAAGRPSLREIVAQRAAGKLSSLSQDDFFIIVDDLEQKRRLKKRQLEG